MTNPLLDFSGLPRFDQVTPAHVEPAISHLLAAAEAALLTVTDPAFPAEWRAIAIELDVATEQLGRAWSVVNHLNAVADTPLLRAAYNAALPRITDFFTRLGSDEALYAKYKAMDVATLDSEQLQAHQNAVRNFVLGGAELAGHARDRFAQIQERQAELSQKFSENVLDATDAFAYFADTEKMAGVPEDVLQATRAAAEADGQPGHKLSLKMPVYLPVMQFARSGALREHLYRAYVTRASDQAPQDTQKFDNSALIREMLELRREEAQLLGFHNFGELSLVPKMANSPGQVIAFLRDLAMQARPFAQQDVTDLRQFAANLTGGKDTPLNPWDIAYLSERLKEDRYAFSEQEVKQYFPLPKVLAGLFKIAETLFDIEIKPSQAPIWHADVRFYRIERACTAANGAPSHQLLGQFYLDPSARTGKRGGAWMDDARARWLRPDSGQLQTPIAHLVCNFASGSMEAGLVQPALLTHDDVTTLFHEFGHGLHHLLTQVNERDVSGISGVEWDAVELPSQFMENFCWEWNVLRHMTAHIDTGAPLPRDLFDKMTAAKNFQSGLQTLRQIEFALFDMLLHTEEGPIADLMTVLDAVRREIAVLQAPAWSRPGHTFSHIFSGGYAAGYYSYKWAEVLSADAYAAFEETMGEDGLPSAQTGRQYRQAILEAGGSRPAMDSFKAFRGREPRLEALLRHQGMASTMAQRTT